MNRREMLAALIAGEVALSSGVAIAEGTIRFAQWPTENVSTAMIAKMAGASSIEIDDGAHVAVMCIDGEWQVVAIECP